MIPNRFHFVFGLRKQTEPFHLAHYLCLESCRQVNRPDAIRFYYHHEPYGPYWDLIKPHLELEKVEPNALVASFRYRDAALDPYRYAHHSDFIRLEKLVKEGGVYADMDTLFVKAIPPNLFEKAFVLGREMSPLNPNTGRTEASLCNALMMSEPEAEFGRRWLDRMAAEFDGTWSNHSTLLPQRLAEEFPASIHVEPESSFYHFRGSGRGLFALLSDDQPIPAEVLSIHLWAHLWWSRQRTDFSAFHAGALTERFIREVDTTFNRAARPFLPEGPGLERDAVSGTWRRWSSAAGEFLREVGDDARALAGTVAIPAIRKIKPGFGRLNLAHARWAYRRARQRFHPRNALEEAVLRWVIQWDEYGIFHSRFKPDDVVLDVGAHVGSFSFACHAMGCRNLQAFEPAPDNFFRLREHVGDLKGITLHAKAVFRSDRPVESLVHSGPNFNNTGSGNVLFGGRVFDAETGEFVEGRGQSGGAVAPAISLDEVLRPLERVRLLKIDCEGSEFPILLTSTLLGKVDRIVGEYHEVPPARMDALAPEARLPGVDSYSAQTLAAGLRKAGYQVTLQSTCNGLGLFEAVRQDG